jgi:hypothetical protein
LETWVKLILTTVRSYKVSFHQFLHHHNHPGLAQYAYWWPQCWVDPIGLHPSLYQLIKKDTPDIKESG